MMKQARVLRGTCTLLLAAMTLLPLTAGATDLPAADEGSSLLARGGGGSGGGRGGFGAAPATAPVPAPRPATAVGMAPRPATASVPDPAPRFSVPAGRKP